eukprot:CAMPEP_0194324598 /NCGR_PEP_ID=MMETSP0171-20130528/28693_1 /TAXON_ID=218684 /ORGANISM="Corethron pennatum, Strain L29A3" /LENGTH=127 /DNA_ID=CAMNT_0039083537 /DNA_START=1 /DNA_END=380 /DNA_ORIENTATION=+
MDPVHHVEPGNDPPKVPVGLVRIPLLLRPRPVVFRVVLDRDVECRAARTPRIPQRVFFVGVPFVILLEGQVPDPSMRRHPRLQDVAGVAVERRPESSGRRVPLEQPGHLEEGEHGMGDDRGGGHFDR